MNRARLVGVSSVAVIAIAAGACGSAVRSGIRSTGTTSPATKLDLASAGGAAPSSVVAGAPSVYPLRATRYVVDAPLPDLGMSAAVRQLNAHAVDVSDAQRFAAALGLGETPTRTSAGWQVIGANAMLTFFVSDGRVDVSYAFGVPSAVGGSTGSGAAATSGSGVANPATKAEPPVVSSGPAIRAAPPVTSVGPPPVPVAPTIVPTVVPPVDVPSAADAQTIARGLLDRVGVLTGLQWSTNVNDTGGVAFACAAGMACPAVPPEVFARTVTFTLMLDGERVSGVNWSVTIGEHRRIEAVNGEWAAPVLIGSYPLRSTTAAFAELQHGTARYPGPQPMTAISGGALEAPATPTPPTAQPTTPTSPSSRPVPMPTVQPIAVHITGVGLGIARWDAYDHGHTVADLVPTYRFHARVEGGTSYDIEVLALAPSTITFTHAVPTPEPLPAQPLPTPAPPPIPSPMLPTPSGKVAGG